MHTKCTYLRHEVHPNNQTMIDQLTRHTKINNFDHMEGPPEYYWHHWHGILDPLLSHSEPRPCRRRWCTYWRLWRYEWWYGYRDSIEHGSFKRFCVPTGQLVVWWLIQCKPPGKYIPYTDTYIISRIESPPQSCIIVTTTEPIQIQITQIWDTKIMTNEGVQTCLKSKQSFPAPATRKLTLYATWKSPF